MRIPIQQDSANWLKKPSEPNANGESGNGGTLADVADILGISEAVASKHYAKWSQDRQNRIAALMKAMRMGTNRARSKKLVVLAS